MYLERVWEGEGLPVQMVMVAVQQVGHDTRGTAMRRDVLVEWKQGGAGSRSWHSFSCRWRWNSISASHVGVGGGMARYGNDFFICFFWGEACACVLQIDCVVIWRVRG